MCEGFRFGNAELGDKAALLWVRSPQQAAGTPSWTPPQGCSRGGAEPPLTLTGFARGHVQGPNVGAPRDGAAGGSQPLVATE